VLKKSSQKSETWDDRARAVISQGCLTYSKRSDQNCSTVPTHYEELNNGTVDMICGLGSNLKGWVNNFALPSIEEVVLAEEIVKKFPVEMVKILKTGSAACDCAVRFARAFTGKITGIGCGYHGSSNWTIACENPGAGCVPEGYIKLASLEACRDYLLGLTNPHGLAYCFLEPVILDWDVGPILKEIRKICTERKVVLIMDETVTNMRVLDFSVCGHYKIRPDIMILGKALANGFPLAVCGGTKAIMSQTGPFISNTHNGELSAITAALDTIRTVTKRDLELLWERGSQIQSAINTANTRIQLKGFPTRGTWVGDLMDVTLFWQEMYKKGWLLGRGWFLNMSVTDEQCLKFIDDALGVFNAMESKHPPKLIGALPVPLFKRYS